MAASRQFARKLMVVVMLMNIAFAAENSPEMQLERALHQEVVLGDLNRAIALYRATVTAAGNRGAVAAEATFHIGLCQEKLGLRKEAYSTFQRLAAEYSGVSSFGKQARLKLAMWSGPRNLEFAEGTVGKVPAGWFVPSLPKDADYLAELRREGCRSHAGCAVVMVPANVPRPVGNMMQSFSAAAYVGKTVRLSAWLRVESLYVSPAYGLRLPNPEDRAQLWLNVERPDHRNSFSDNMDDRPVRSSNWTKCEIVGQIDEDAQFINFGVMSIGGGRVWVDDVTFEIVPTLR